MKSRFFYWVLILFAVPFASGQSPAAEADFNNYEYRFLPGALPDRPGHGSSGDLELVAMSKRALALARATHHRHLVKEQAGLSHSGLAPTALQRPLGIRLGLDAYESELTGTVHEPGGSATLPVDPELACPGFYILRTHPGPNTRPGRIGTEILIESSGSRRLQGGLNFGGRATNSVRGFTAFSINNPAQEKQVIHLALVAGARGHLRLEQRHQNGPSIVLIDLFVEAGEKEVSVEVDPGFYVVGFQPQGNQPVPYTIAALTSYLERPGGGFHGGAVVGGYHDTSLETTTFAAFCIDRVLDVAAQILSTPTYGLSAARDIGFSLANSDGTTVLDSRVRSISTVAPIAGANGRLVPSDPESVLHGDRASFEVVPNAGYEISTVTATCGGDLAGQIFTTNPVYDDCTVAASFRIRRHTVTPLESLNGNISPSEPQSVAYGQPVSFALMPNVGFGVAEVIGTCVGSVSDNTFTTGPVRADCEFQADFRQQLTVTPVSALNGVIQPGQPVLTFKGDTVTFELVPDNNFQIATVGGTCGGSLQGQFFTTDPVVSNCSVEPVFSIRQHTVTPLTTPNGHTIPAEPQIVDFEHVVDFKLIPDAGFAVSEVISDCGGHARIDRFTSLPVTKDCTVVVDFSPGFLVDISVEGPGTVQPFGPQAVPTGGGLPISIYPAIGYRIGNIESTCEGSRFYLGFKVIDVDYHCEVVIEFVPGSEGVINDTGIDWCSASETEMLDCPIEDYPDQDGDFGRDALYRMGVLEKVGFGLAGFDYSKLDGQGNDLPDESPEWSCVRDNHTRLIWEIKDLSETSPRRPDFRYSWYQPDSLTKGGYEGAGSGGDCGQEFCSIHDYVDFINEIELCGFSDWRIPDIEEVRTLRSFGQQPPATNHMVFDDEVGDHLFAHLGSSTSVASDLGTAWGQSIRSGIARHGAKSTTGVTWRLVRGGQQAIAPFNDLSPSLCTNTDLPASTPSAAFTLIDNGTIVRHEKTGLEWQRCSYGQSWNGISCQGAAARLSWQDALQLDIENSTGWRLPNVVELSSIIERCANRPAINGVAFPNTPFTYSFWTSSPSLMEACGDPRCTDVEPASWLVNFDNGLIGIGGRWAGRWVRLVRESHQ